MMALILFRKLLDTNFYFQTSGVNDCKTPSEVVKFMQIHFEFLKYLNKFQI